MKSEGKMMKKEGRGMAKADMQKASPVKKMAKGGLAAGHKAADGMAKKGKTKGMEVKMARGGLTKSEVKKADAAGRKVTRELKYDDMKDRAAKMARGGKTC
jgi:hypothetical protein